MAGLWTHALHIVLIRLVVLHARPLALQVLAVALHLRRVDVGDADAAFQFSEARRQLGHGSVVLGVFGFHQGLKLARSLLLCCARGALARWGFLASWLRLVAIGLRWYVVRTCGACFRLKAPVLLVCGLFKPRHADFPLDVDAILGEVVREPVE
jgi:hypothetical protein